MTIRPARAGDGAAIAAFWAPVIANTTITFSTHVPTPEEIDATIATKARDGYGYFVAESAGAVIGFATYGQFRPSNGYRHAGEHTIILAPEARGQGAGRALMQAVEQHAKSAGMHCMMAGVSGENAAGIAFHAAIGYAHVARVPEVGRKFDRWLDLVLMQKIL